MHQIIDKLEFKKLYQQFKKDCDCEINKSFFYKIFFNAKHSPYYNSFSDVTSYPHYLKSIYLKTKGKLPKAVRNLYKSFNKDYLSKTIVSDSEKDILNELNTKGFFVIKDFLSNEQVDKILKELESFNYQSRNLENQNIKFLRENYKKPNNKLSSTFYYSRLNDQIISKKSFIGSLLINNFMERVSSLYFSSQAYLVGLSSFFSREDRIGNETGDQKFHFDYSHLCFLKFFIYLDDVTKKNGPHVSIESSHEDNFNYPKTDEAFYKNDLFRVYPNGEKEGLLKDEFIEKNVNKEKIKYFSYPKGTLIIENTTNIHKGLRVCENKREMLSFIYAISAIGQPTPKYLPTLDYDPVNNNATHLYQILKNKKSQCIKTNELSKKKYTMVDRIKMKLLPNKYLVKFKYKK